MKKIYTLFLLAALILNVHTSAFAQDVDAQNALKQEKAYAAQLLEDNKTEEAYEAYSVLLQKKPSDLHINLGYARAALHTKRYGQATLTYERLLAQYPNEPILLKELAYALAMQDDEQRAEMELAKNPKASAEENEDLLATWAEVDKRTHTKGKLSLGVIFDSNFNAGPASRDLTVGVWNVRLAEEAERQETFANYIAANLDIAHKVSEDSPWWLIAKTSLYARYNYASEANDLDLSSSEYASGSVGVRHLTNNSMFEMNINAQVFDYQFMESTFAIGPEINFVYVLTPKIHLISNLSLMQRAYSDNSHYNGLYTSAGQYARIFMGSLGHNITLGARYVGADTNNQDYAYDGFEASADLTLILPYDLRLSTFFAYGEEHFKGVASALETEKRRDQRIRTGVALMIPLSEAWEIALGYQYTKNHSNSELFSYDQHLATFAISWKF